MNVGCCTKDLSKIKTDWNSEYKNNISSQSEDNQDIYPISWNYEIAPNIEKNAKLNVVSKHCILSEKNFKNVSNTDSYYSLNYLCHFNQ